MIERTVIDVGSSSDTASAIVEGCGGVTWVVGHTLVDLSETVVVNRLLQDGSRDLHFGKDGVLPLHKFKHATSAVVQSDCKLVITGHVFNGSDYDLFIVRLLENGDLDSGFGNSGWVVIDYGGRQDFSQSIVVDRSGNFYVIGYSRSSQGVSCFVGALDPRGQLRNTYGNGGKLELEFGGDSAFCYDAVIDGQLRLYVGGIAYTDGDFDLAVAKFKPSGKPAQGFGSGGIYVHSQLGNQYLRSMAINSRKRLFLASTSIEQGHEAAQVLSLKGNGKLNTQWAGTGLLKLESPSQSAGMGVWTDAQNRTGVYTRELNGEGQNLSLYRFKQNGKVDTGFGEGGGVILEQSLGTLFGTDIVLNSQNEILVLGMKQGWVDLDTLAFRVLRSGKLDDSFGQSGTQTFNVGLGWDQAHSMKMDHRGKFLLGGAAKVDVDNRMSLVRVKENGELDLSFADKGKFRYTVQANSIVKQVFERADFNYLLVGEIGRRNRDVLLVALDRRGEYFNGFSEDGQREVDVGGEDTVTSGLILFDGSVLVGGYSQVGSKLRGWVFKVDSEGEIETQFGNAGFIYFDEPNSIVSSISHTDNGTFVLVGTEYSSVGERPFMRELGVDGAILSEFDLSFALEYRLTFQKVFSEGGFYYVFGDRWVQNGKSWFAVKLTNDGKLEPDFGLITAELQSGVLGTLKEASSDSEGITLSGNLFLEGQPQLALMRLNWNGTWDTSFGPGGLLTFPSSVSNRACATHSSDGKKFYVLGEAQSYGQQDLAFLQIQF